ncbi:MAG: hypothetical protein IJ634_02965 [Bacteroidales bacterium]|nr:hypothetical protein [Bacteroidales bacterium]
MKRVFNINKSILVVALAAMVMAFAACEHNENVSPREQQRVIVYAVGHEEGRATVKDNAELDQLLERFCSYAQGGSEVVFYNTATSQAPSDKGATTVRKDVTTFSTTDREEMKSWMKDMEKAGKTVSVKYDDKTGTWSGTAYVNAPNHEEVNDCYTGTLALVAMPAVTEPVIPGTVAALVVSPDSVLLLVKDGYLSTMVEDVTDGLHAGDIATLCGELKTVDDMNGESVLVLDLTREGSVLGQWRLSCMAVTETGNGMDYILSTSLYVPDAEGESITLTLRDDGTATYTVTGAEASSQDGTWSFGEEGMLCCELLPGEGGCWYINWLTNTTLIVSRPSDDGSAYYQLQFEK